VEISVFFFCFFFCVCVSDVLKICTSRLRPVLKLPLTNCGILVCVIGADKMFIKGMF